MELIVDREVFSIKDLPLIGEHNFRNYICAILAARLDGVTINDSINSLKTFKGVLRRMDLVGEFSGVSIYDDFAHHPTAIKLSTSAIRENFPNKKILGLVELGSNTMSSGHHKGDLLESYQLLDKTILLDHKKVYELENTFYSSEEILKELKEIIFEYDIILIMTNKDSQKFIQPIINYLEEK